MIFVIVPKDDSDYNTWLDCKERYSIVLDGENKYRIVEDSGGGSCEPRCSKICADKKDGNEVKNVLIIPYVERSYKEDKEYLKRSISCLNDNEVKLFVHFGEIEIKNDLDTIEKVFEKWKNHPLRELFEENKLKIKKNIVPYSLGSEYQWKEDITQAQQAARNGKNPLLHLKNAWSNAWDYYHKDKPVEELARTVAPLIVDVQNRADERISDEELLRSFEAVQQKIEKLQQDFGHVCRLLEEFESLKKQLERPNEDDLKSFIKAVDEFYERLQFRGKAGESSAS